MAKICENCGRSPVDYNYKMTDQELAILEVVDDLDDQIKFEHEPYNNGWSDALSYAIDKIDEKLGKYVYACKCK